jgi:hypothetical protein
LIPRAFQQHIAAISDSRTSRDSQYSARRNAGARIVGRHGQREIKRGPAR